MTVVQILVTVLPVLVTGFISDRYDKQSSRKNIYLCIAAAIGFSLNQGVEHYDQWSSEPQVTVTSKYAPPPGWTRFDIEADKSNVDSVSIEYNVRGHVLATRIQPSVAEAESETWVEGEARRPYVTNRIELLLRKPAPGVAYTFAFEHVDVPVPPLPPETDFTVVANSRPLTKSAGPVYLCGEVEQVPTPEGLRPRFRQTYSGEPPKFVLQLESASAPDGGLRPLLTYSGENAYKVTYAWTHKGERFYRTVWRSKDNDQDIPAPDVEVGTIIYLAGDSECEEVIRQRSSDGDAGSYPKGASACNQVAQRMSPVKRKLTYAP